MSVPVFDESVVRNTLTAMVAVIMGRNESTRGHANDYVVTWKGEAGHGIHNAERVLIESLAEHTDAWVDYLALAENRKVATSMDVALNADLAKRLEQTADGQRITATLRHVLNDIPVFEPMPTGEHKVIDLRQAEAMAKAESNKGS